MMGHRVVFANLLFKCRRAANQMKPKQLLALSRGGCCAAPAAFTTTTSQRAQQNNPLNAWLHFNQFPVSIINNKLLIGIIHRRICVQRLPYASAHDWVLRQGNMDQQPAPARALSCSICLQQSRHGLKAWKIYDSFCRKILECLKSKSW